MSNVSEWSTSAGSNNASPPNGWPEGMARSAVNDAAREMMGALARWYQDSIGTLTTAGGTIAYTLTTNSAHTNLNDIPMMSIKFNAANTTTGPTLNVDGLGAKPIVRSSGTIGVGDLTTGKVYIIIYNLAASRFEVLNALTGDTFDPGTIMLFQQTAAPTNWTKGATHNNKALRLQTGTVTTGGSSGFTTVFASRSIAQGNLPSYTLPNSLSVDAHSHGSGTLALPNTSITNGSANFANNATTRSDVPAGGGNTVVTGLVLNSLNLSLPTNAISGSTGSISPGISGSVTSGGSGTALDFNVQYVDVILATRN